MNNYRRTRPPGQMPEVILHIIIINVLVFFGTQLSQFRFLDYLFTGFSVFSSDFRPWQIITHFFMHGSVSHLLFNMFGLWMFGRVLTSVWDSKRFLFFYFSCALGAFLAHQIYLVVTYGTHPPDADFSSIPINYGTAFLGASGAVYGIVVAFATLFPNAQVMLLIPPIPMKAKYMVILLVILDFIGGFSSFNTGIAHFAHLGGALTGYLLVRYWQKNSKTFY